MTRSKSGREDCDCTSFLKLGCLSGSHCMQVLWYCWAKLELQSGSQLNRLLNSNFNQQHSTTTAAYSAGYSVHTYITCHKTQLSFRIYQLIKVYVIYSVTMIKLRLISFEPRYVSQWSWSHGLDPSQLPVPTRCTAHNSDAEHGEFAEGGDECWPCEIWLWWVRFFKNWVVLNWSMDKWKIKCVMHFRVHKNILLQLTKQTTDMWP